MMSRMRSLRFVPKTSFSNTAKRNSKNLVGGQVGGSRQRVQALKNWRHRTADDLLEQGFLVIEMEINGALGDAGAGGDVVEPRSLEPALGEHVERGIENGLFADRGLRLTGAALLAPEHLGR